MLIGDLGQPRGGPTLSGHRSHQTGLDVDIWFLLSTQAASHTLAFKERETWNAPSVLVGQSDTIDYRQWSKANEKVLEVAAQTAEVDRIFVNPSIKRELCLTHARHDWLRKIRPWGKHDDHFHVRLNAPKTITTAKVKNLFHKAPVAMQSWRGGFLKKPSIPCLLKYHLSHWYYPYFVTNY